MLCRSCGRVNTSDAVFCNACGTKLILLDGVASDALGVRQAAEVTPEPLSPSRRMANPVSSAAGVFVGRQRAMGELQVALEDALSSQGRVVMLAGEPGIGKTRTSQELTRYAGQRGAQVLWARCHSEQGAPSYWPWVQVIRSYVRDCDTEKLRSQMGTGAADIAEIVPEVREQFADLDLPPILDPQQARFRLFDSITAFLKNASQVQPLVVVMDNLHWADRPSLQLLEFVAQEVGQTRLLVLGTYRDTELTRRHPLTQTLGELAQEPAFRRITLRGLSQEEVGDFIEVTSGLTPSNDLVEAVYVQTEGNPLFMAQVVQLLLQEGALAPGQVVEQSWSIRIPAGVHEAIGRRLDRLSEDCNQVLTVASVVGREFELGLLERLMPESAEFDLLNAVEEAMAAGIIEELPQAASRYQFSHVLVQNTLTRELSAARRARLQSRIAESLEVLYESNLESHASELAYHFAEAASVIGTEKMVRYSLMAGERALATYAQEEAVDHFQRGLEAKEGQPTDADTAALLFGLGCAQLATLERYQVGDALVSLHRALDYYVEVGEVSRAVAIAECPLSTLPGHLSGVTKLMARALELVSPGSHQAGRLLPRYGMALGLQEGNYDDALDIFDQALAIAQREGDEWLEMRTLASASYVDIFHLRWQPSLEKGLRAIDLAQMLDDPHTEALARFWAANAHFDMGDPEEAGRHASASLAPAERLRDRQRLASAYWVNGNLHQLKGNWSAAREFSDSGLVALATDPRLLSSRVLLEYQVGKPKLGNAYLERVLEAMHLTPPLPSTVYAFPAILAPLVAHITGEEVGLESAESAAETVLASPYATPYVQTLARVGLGLLAVLLGDIQRASEQYTALKSVQGTMVPGSMIAADRVLGLVAGCIGELAAAAGHFENALSLCRRAGYRPEYAWSAYDYANTLAQSTETKSAQVRGQVLGQARKLLEESLEIARELDMAPLRDRITALQEQVGHHHVDAPEYPDGMTGREVEVLCQVVTGKSNREIAEDLVLSIRTVERHITNIYAKIGARGRADATAYGLSHNLLNNP